MSNNDDVPCLKNFFCSNSSENVLTDWYALISMLALNNRYRKFPAFLKNPEDFSRPEELTTFAFQIDRLLQMVENPETSLSGFSEELKACREFIAETIVPYITAGACVESFKEFKADNVILCLAMWANAKNTRVPKILEEIEYWYIDVADKTERLFNAINAYCEGKVK